MSEVAKRRVKSARVAKPMILGASSAVKTSVEQIQRNFADRTSVPFRGLYNGK